MDTDNYRTIQEAASELGVSFTALQAHVHRKNIASVLTTPGRANARVRLIHVDEIERFKARPERRGRPRKTAKGTD